MVSSYLMFKILKKKRVFHKRPKLEKIEMSEGREDRESNDVTKVDVKRKFRRLSVKPKIETWRLEIPSCRICLKDGIIPIYGDETLPDISEVVKAFGGIQFSEDDEFPKHICDACHNLLQSAIAFRESALDSERILHENNELNTETEVFVEEPSDNECEHSEIIENINQNLKKSYSCKLCALEFKSPDDCLAHKNSKQHRNVRIQCPICNKLLTTQLYKRHYEKHQSPTHSICEFCGKMFRKDNLIRHLQLHSFELPFRCHVCPYRGRYAESLRIHLRTHTGERPFICDKCNLSFLTRSNLNRHLITHSKEKPHQCLECGKGFVLKRDLDAHLKSDHFGIKDYDCKTCGMKFATRKSLTRHEVKVHKRDKMMRGRIPLYLQEGYRKLVDET